MDAQLLAKLKLGIHALVGLVQLLTLVLISEVTDSSMEQLLLRIVMMETM